MIFFIFFERVDSVNKDDRVDVKDDDRVDVTVVMQFLLSWFFSIFFNNEDVMLAFLMAEC